jgi:hypothetical protein
MRRPPKKVQEVKAAKSNRTRGKQKELAESSNDEIYPGQSARKKKHRRISRGTTGKVKEELESGRDENMASHSGEEHAEELKPKKRKKKYKVFEREPEQDRPETPPGTSRKAKKRRRDKLVAAAEAEKNIDVEMEMGESVEAEVEAEEEEEPPQRRLRRRRKRKPHNSGSEDTIQPLINKISNTNLKVTTRSSGSSRNSNHPADPTSASDTHRPKKRKRPSERSVSPILEVTAASPSGPEVALRRDQIQLQLQEINLRKHELSVRESELKLELKKIGLQARMDVDSQSHGQVYANCVCSACGEFGHNRINRFKCTRHPKYLDWYAQAS